MITIDLTDTEADRVLFELENGEKVEKRMIALSSGMNKETHKNALDTITRIMEKIEVARLSE